MNLGDWVVKFADGYKVPSEIALAVASVESNMQMGKSEFRPGHVWLWNWLENRPFRRLLPEEINSIVQPEDFHPHIFDGGASEWVFQRTAWGPFQIVGSSLRQAGYGGRFIAHCTDPELAARWGVRQLSFLRDKYLAKHGWPGVVIAFRAGRPRKTRDGEYIYKEYLEKLVKAGAGRFL
jgi:hypothetical protein